MNRTAVRERIDSLLSAAGTTYAEQAGVRLADSPGPLWQLLVFSDLVSARIQAEIAVTGSRSLFAARAELPRKWRRSAGRRARTPC